MIHCLSSRLDRLIPFSSRRTTKAGRRLGLDDNCVTVGLIELWKGGLEVLQDLGTLGREGQKRTASASQLILTSASLCSRSPSALQPSSGNNEHGGLSENISVLTGKVDIRSIFTEKRAESTGKMGATMGKVSYRRLSHYPSSEVARTFSKPSTDHGDGCLQHTRQEEMNLLQMAACVEASDRPRIESRRCRRFQN
jgi:hypothetical protein